MRLGKQIQTVDRLNKLKPRLRFAFVCLLNTLIGHDGLPTLLRSPKVAAVGHSAPAVPAVDAPASDQECANCGSLAKKRCTGYDHGVERDGTKSPPTYHCSKYCQRYHWAKTHHHECKLAIDRRQLFRIGRLVQWAFYAAIKAMWSEGIVDVEEIEYTGGAPLRVKCYNYKTHDQPDFPSFPESGFNFKGYGGGLGEADKQAVLAKSARNGNVVCGLLDELVRGEFLLNMLLELH